MSVIQNLFRRNDIGMVNILSSLPKIVFRKKKRRGRGLGSGKGAKSGRGTTRHQKAREKIPLHFEGGQGRMVKKFPLLRGKGRNKPLHVKPFLLNLAVLNIFKDNEVITIDGLIKANIVGDEAKKRGVKILGSGKLEKKLIIKIPASKSAVKVIESTGGRLEL